MQYLTNLDELPALMERAAATGDEQARVSMLCDFRIHDPRLTSMQGDPFSAAYRDQVLAAHALVSGRALYDPARDEKIPIDPIARAKRPSIYSTGGSRHLGMFLEAFGQILQAADLPAHARVLEYGPGDGQLSLHIARMGCDVTVVDIEPKNLLAVTRQAEMLGASVTAIEADFCAAPLAGVFDVVIFFETFHHAINHADLLHIIRHHLSPAGRIIFAGEPIIPAGDYWADTVPFPWGLRLDALSLCAGRTYGWMELGFQETYFYELLDRTGFRCEKRTSASNGRGTCWIAHEKNGSNI